MANPVPPIVPHDKEPTTASRPTPPMVVALTGVHGLVGSRCLDQLIRDTRVARIVCVDVKAPSSSSPKVAFVDLDLTSQDAEHALAAALADHRVECVAHMAFRDGPSPYPGYSHELESIGTMRVVQSCLEARIRKLLMSSRTWVYGANSNAPALIDEMQPMRARRSERFLADKIDAERDVLSFRAPGRGRTSTILRMAPLVDPLAECHVLRLLRDQRVPSVLGFDPMWQLLHVQDACRAMLHLMFRDAPAIVNVASAGAVPLSVARRLLGARPVPLPRSLAAALVGGLWLTGAGLIPPSLLDYLQFPCVADCTLSRAVLRFTPAHSTLSILEEIACASATQPTTRSAA